MNVTIPVQSRAVLQKIGQLADQAGVPAYAVGGCVRDWLLRRPGGGDLDIAVEGSGIALARAAARELGGTVTAHEQFGTATLTLGAPPECRIDFAACRRERYARPAAYPKIVPGALRDDLLRRDFTINAMAVALNGRRQGALIDPFDGARDLRRKRLRILHERSLLDDPSRILRGVRFLSRFGFRWDSSTERAARRAIATGSLGWLNAGRLRKELTAMLAEPDPLACLHALATLMDSVPGETTPRA